MKTELTNAAGKSVKLPMFDPLVAAHFNNPSSLTDTLIDQINREKIYEKLFKDSKDLTFLDIGANIGLVSLYAAPVCKRIVAVEPAPETFKVLQAMTLGYPQIECVQAALAPSDGPQEFFTNMENATASSCVNTFGEFGQVQGFKLSSILKIYQLERVDVCKVDCEGNEGESLTFEELQWAKAIIKTFYIEFHNCPKTSWENKMGVAIGYLASLCYATETDGMTLIASL